MLRLAAGTTLLAVTALWLPPSAGAARPQDQAPVTVEVVAFDEVASDEARALTEERADRGQRQTPPPVATTAPAPPPATTAPPKTTPPPKKKTTPPAPRKSTTSPKVGAAVQPPSGAAGTVVSYALAQVGKAYVYNTSGPNSFDCSGLVMAAYARVGVKLPHQSEQIAAKGRRVPSGQWMPGDVIHTPGHVGIYIGNGKMVAATKPATGVQIRTVQSGTAYRFL